MVFKFGALVGDLPMLQNLGELTKILVGIETITIAFGQKYLQIYEIKFQCLSSLVFVTINFYHR